jgi:omega-6 fatty acid desaturase (delta-12 desaturase)
LSPRIPNYNLARCHRQNPQLATARPITLRSSLKCLRLSLWNETDLKMVRFNQLPA